MVIPEFSILIANYNNAKFLKDCFNSLIEQTFKIFEIIFVDDHSMDNSIEIVNKYKSILNINTYINEVNKGQGFTKNKCAQLAKSEILGFLDPDDALFPEAIETMVNAHKLNRKYSIIYSSHSVCDKDLNIIHPKGGVAQIPEGQSHLTRTGSGISAFATFKRSHYLLTEGIDPMLKRAPDQDLYSKLEEIAPVLYIDQPLYLYRWHTGGLSSMNDNKLKARYWNNIVVTNAYKRRRKKENLIVPKITYSQVKKSWGNYFISKCLEQLKCKEYNLTFKYWIRSLPYVIFNRQIIIRIKILIAIISKKQIKNTKFGKANS